MRPLTVYLVGVSLSSYLKASVQQPNFQRSLAQCRQCAKAALNEHFPTGEDFRWACGNGRWHGILLPLIGRACFLESSCCNSKNEGEHTEK